MTAKNRVIRTGEELAIRRASDLYLECLAIDARDEAQSDPVITGRLFREKLASDPGARQAIADVTATLSVPRRPGYYINRVLKD